MTTNRPRLISASHARTVAAADLAAEQDERWRRVDAATSTTTTRRPRPVTTTTTTRRPVTTTTTTAAPVVPPGHLLLDPHEVSALGRLLDGLPDLSDDPRRDWL